MKKQTMLRLVKLFLHSATIIGLVLMVNVALANPALGCDYFASPTGTGNGISEASPYTISDFWANASPGKTLCLLDGTYRGSNSMIKPPSLLNGTSSAPITVKALNDGMVTLDGQGANRTVHLIENDYFVLEGFNAHNSSMSVVTFYKSDHNVIRRVVAWDAPNLNVVIFGSHESLDNLLEDIAGFGTARKIISASQAGTDLTCRRCWGMWEYSTETGPKMAMAPVYNVTGVTIENSIFTWNSVTSSVDNGFGIVSVDRIDGRDRRAFLSILGSILYVPGNTPFQPGQQMLITKIDEVDIKDTISYFGNGANLSRKTFHLSGCRTAHLGGSPCSNPNLKATNLTSVGGAGPSISSDWNQTNVRTGDTTTDIYPQGENIFVNSGNVGATICKRYKDGVLSNENLWPWPMNQRIIDAMSASGRQPVDVTATIEQMFGAIPDECKGEGDSNPPPSPPTNLRFN